jgi:hypothetical protein
VVILDPKKGGRLAFKGLVTAFILAIIFVMATNGDNGAQAAGMVIAFGIGAAYIISSLRKWDKNNEVVHGAGIGWTVAALLLLLCVGALLNVHSGGNGRGTSVSSSGASTPENPSSGAPTPENPSSGASTPENPKDILLRDVKLGYKWYKEGFGSVMIADFTVKNPTQYSFKDFEITCTDSGPSGTVIDSNTRTIYEIVEPISTKVIKRVNMGFIHSQAARSKCEITDLVPGSL